MRKHQTKYCAWWNLFSRWEPKACLGICMHKHGAGSFKPCVKMFIFLRSEKCRPPDALYDFPHPTPTPPPKEEEAGWDGGANPAVVLKINLMLLFKGWIDIGNKWFVCTKSQGNLCWHQLLSEQEKSCVICRIVAIWDVLSLLNSYGGKKID